MPTKKELELLDAAESGKLELVSQLIEQGIDIKAKDVLGYTSLHNAAKNGHLEVVKLLIAKNADVNAQTTTK
ncbi:MAG TPA: ankyrin repeat domain-containing protein, partial [Wolbachia sp.]|nr:ankyrin repeat domain-containing protein [Wolbachia sp.]